jgi:5'-nucleotidase
MKHILITNDDGYDQAGLIALRDALIDIAKVTVVAPASEKSACGHSLTLTKPLRIIEVQKDFYKMDDGTPTDCIFVSLDTLFKDKKPDLIISGINMGSNMGEDITYSGTASAAMEGVLQGIPSIAISQVYNKQKGISPNWNFALAKKSIKDIVLKIFNNKFPLPNRKFLNINIPYININESKGTKITNAGYRKYNNETHKHIDPRGKEYYWIGIHPLIWKKIDNDYICDFEAIQSNCISISPIKVDMTSYDDISILNEWIKE